MPDFVLGHTQSWIDHFASQGHDARALAAGVEGAIYDLGRGLIAEVWRERATVDLERMQSFYADVAAAGLPFQTPEIIEIRQVDGTSVTYETFSVPWPLCPPPAACASWPFWMRISPCGPGCGISGQQR